ncbi:MAG TPA: hypothetical protein VEA80_07250 [Vitreimonas sp.]|uniref:hypothetical protein n=1 Tax=Vitreimonas sp. TaxID=3069702 RepID=UPI002D43BEC6|nr:hypothetical protein [Vitreimonas sp.]HYD87253.1 hypothetical protein [Vitreimonas sp.]
MKLRAMMLALALAACGQAGQQVGAQEAEAPDPFNLNIEVGRYGVMLDQVENLSSEAPNAAEPEVTDPRDLARRLRETVWQYNLERSSLCARGLYTAVSCGPSYQPVWIGEPADASPSLEELQTRSNALGEEVMRFWDAVCEEARAAEADAEARQYVCAIE